MSGENSLVELQFNDMNKLLKIYQVNWPKFVVIYSAIESFIRRAETFPELKERLKIYSLSDASWTKDGTFAMIFDCVTGQQFLFFDTISESPVRLKALLNLLDYSNELELFCTRDDFKTVIHELLEERNLETVYEQDTKCFYLSIEDALKLTVEIPKSFSLKSLNDSHVSKIYSVWPHRDVSPEDFIRYSIKYHDNIGLFDSNDDLVAWCLRYDNGSCGMLQVEENHVKKGFGSLVVKALSKKIVMNEENDVTAHIMHDNFRSIRMFEKIGFRQIDTNSWIGLRIKNETIK